MTQGFSTLKFVNKHCDRFYEDRSLSEHKATEAVGKFQKNMCNAMLVKSNLTPGCTLKCFTAVSGWKFQASFLSDHIRHHQWLWLGVVVNVLWCHGGPELNNWRSAKTRFQGVLSYSLKHFGGVDGLAYFKVPLILCVCMRGHVGCFENELLWHLALRACWA